MFYLFSWKGKYYCTKYIQYFVAMDVLPFPLESEIYLYKIHAIYCCYGCFTFSAGKGNITVQNTCNIVLLWVFNMFSWKAKYYCTKYMQYFVAMDVLPFQLEREILLYKIHAILCCYGCLTCSAGKGNITVQNTCNILLLWMFYLFRWKAKYICTKYMQYIVAMVVLPFQLEREILLYKIHAILCCYGCLTCSAGKGNITVQNTCNILLLWMFYLFRWKAKYICTKYMQYIVAMDVLPFQLEREILLYKIHAIFCCYGCFTFSAGKRNISVQNTCNILLLWMFYLFSWKGKYYCTKYMQYFVAMDVLPFALESEIYLYKIHAIFCCY